MAKNPKTSGGVDMTKFIEKFNGPIPTMRRGKVNPQLEAIKQLQPFDQTKQRYVYQLNEEESRLQGDELNDALRKRAQTLSSTIYATDIPWKASVRPDF